MDNMFEYVVRNKVRFPYKGLIAAEDLWDLSVENLDAIYKTLNTSLKQTKEDSLLSKPSKQDYMLSAQIEVVKYIVAVKQDEAVQRLKAKENREKKQRIMEIMANKQDADLQNKSLEELNAMLESIGE